ncbi:MAG: NADAR family protein [Bdellovibrionales bacterium]
MEPITFYEPEDENGWLSSLAPYEIVMNGVVWPTAEHWYQAQKFPNDPTLQEFLRRTSDPRTVKAIARDNKDARRADWDDVKVSMFYEANMTKFIKHPALWAQLLETGHAELVEQSPHDPFWGRAANGTGENMVGVVLMYIRDELRNARMRA